MGDIVIATTRVDPALWHLTSQFRSNRRVRTDLMARMPVQVSAVGDFHPDWNF